MSVKELIHYTCLRVKCCLSNRHYQMRNQYKATKCIFQPVHFSRHTHTHAVGLSSTHSVLHDDIVSSVIRLRLVTHVPLDSRQHQHKPLIESEHRCAVFDSLRKSSAIVSFSKIHQQPKQVTFWRVLFKKQSLLQYSSSVSHHARKSKHTWKSE